MPRELFGTVSLRPGRVRSRRSSVVIASVTVHAAAISVVLIAPLFATDALPLPQHAIEVGRDVVLVSLPPPPPPPPRMVSARSNAPSSASAPAPSVPLHAPSGVSDETSPKDLPTGAGLGAGPSSIGDGPGLVAGAFGPAQLPAPPPTPPRPIKISDGVRAPRRLVDVPPVYPPLARAAHIEGIVVIEATIAPDGSVQAARVLSANHTESRRLLEEAALEAVRQWRYSPTLLNGVPVPVIMTVTVKFTLL